MLRDIVRPFTPELAAARTGIPADTIRRLAREFAGAPAACAFGRVVCGRFGTLAAWSLEVLNIVTGNLDRPGGSIFSEGLVDLVDVVARLGLDGYGKHRSRVGNLPGVLGELPSGVLADEITTPGPGQSPLIPDDAHQPSIAYVPYLITGDRYYAEEMAFWANYSMLRTYPAERCLEILRTPQLDKRPGFQKRPGLRLPNSQRLLSGGNSSR